AGLAIVHEVGGWKEAGDRLHAAGFAIDRVLGVRRSGLAGHADYQREMPAGRAAGDAQAIRRDVKARRIVPDKADGAIHVLDRFGDRVLGLAAVYDGEDGVSALEQGR